MFTDLTSDPFPFSEPWEGESLDDRLAVLTGPAPRVAWFCESPNSVSFRYRVFNLIEAVRSGPRPLSATWFEMADLEPLLQRLGQLETLVLSRVRYCERIAWLVAAAKSQGVRVLFECDDLVFDTRYTHLVYDTLAQGPDYGAPWDWWFALIGRTEAAARLCDGGITTNAFLAARLAEVVAGPVTVVPNFMNHHQLAVSEQLLVAKQSRSFVADQPLTIGYFSGTPTHSHDFAIVQQPLARLLHGDPDVRLRIVGCLDHLGPLADFHDRLECLPFHDWLNLQRLIAEVDINIAPLQDNAYTNAKSPLKFFEAAAVGTWTVASPTMTFRDAIRDPGLGRLAAVGDWNNALAESIALVRQPDRYQPLAERAAAYVHDAFGWNRHAQAVRNATVAAA